MPLSSYEGNTFVAFVDISGFKKRMRYEREAWKALDILYNTGHILLGVLLKTSMTKNTKNTELNKI